MEKELATHLNLFRLSHSVAHLLFSAYPYGTHGKTIWFGLSARR